MKLKYSNGLLVEIGDKVLIENGKTEGIVHDIIETKEKMNFWGIKEKGLMIKSKPFGLVFWPIDDMDPIIFVERGKGLNEA